jgi:hypothetical protein
VTRNGDRNGKGAPDDSARKRLVMAAHAAEAISDRECRLLITGLMLVAA